MSVVAKLAAIFVLGGLFGGCSVFYPDFYAPSKLDGIASHYIYDSGISNHGEVIFSDDFESWDDNGREPPEHTWGVHVSDRSVSRTRLVPGRVSSEGIRTRGQRILEIACWNNGAPGGQLGGLTLKLGNYDNPDEGLGDGYEEIYVRYYIKFDSNYRNVLNHGVNIGGRDVTSEDSAWVGQSAISNIAESGYFFSGLEPAGLRGDDLIEFDIYSYNLDKRTAWGEEFRSQRRIYMHVGTWYCVERHLKLNTVDPVKGTPNFDGLEEVWIDGNLTTRVKDIRYRKTNKLRITYLALETYYHHLPEVYGVDNPIRVYFDNVVIARNYIGPLGRPQ